MPLPRLPSHGGPGRWAQQVGTAPGSRTRATRRAQRHSPCRCRNGATEWHVRRGASGGRRPEQSAEGGEGQREKKTQRAKLTKSVHAACSLEKLRAVTVALVLRADTGTAGRRGASGASCPEERADFSKSSSVIPVAPGTPRLRGPRNPGCWPYRAHCEHLSLLDRAMSSPGTGT